MIEVCSRFPEYHADTEQIMVIAFRSVHVPHMPLPVNTKFIAHTRIEP